MNWLLYIGLGFILFGMWMGIINELVANRTGQLLYWIAFIMVWIWICWKFA